VAQDAGADRERCAAAGEASDTVNAGGLDEIRQGHRQHGGAVVSSEERWKCRSQ
jgi:hypothetical protein